MEIIEYPKALYRNGAYMEVADEAEEAVANDDGWTDWHSDHERTNGAAVEADTPELNRDELKLQAKELGLTYSNFIKTEKLAELVAGVSKD